MTNWQVWCCQVIQSFRTHSLHGYYNGWPKTLSGNSSPELLLSDKSPPGRLLDCQAVGSGDDKEEALSCETFGAVLPGHKDVGKTERLCCYVFMLHLSPGFL